MRKSAGSRRAALAGLLAALVANAAGCGDNSRSCGPGTVVMDGFCVPTAVCGFGTRADEETGECVPDGAIVCSAGTRFDPLTGTCEVDPASCGNGTVLIDGRCVDPTFGLVADLQEGPEPNGLGVIEASAAQAGNIVLEPVGGSFVIHGTLDPHRDADNDGLLDPDVDTYVLVTTGAVLVSIKADGVNGISGGFVMSAVAGSGEPMQGWRRFAVDLDGDASTRQIYVPVAGTYRLAVADTRTLTELATTGASTVAPGGDDGDYFISIDQLPLPAATSLAVNAGSASAAGAVANTVPLFAVPLGATQTTFTLSMSSSNVVASLVVIVDDVVRGVDDEAGAPAQVVVTGAGTTTVIVVDHAYDVSPTPAAFALDVQIQ